MNKPQINVTPLIDVLLVLLIIFMVVTPMKPSAFDAKIPREPTNEPVDVNPDTLVVIVESDSTLTLNKDKLAASVDESSELTTRLRAIFELRKQKALDDSGAPTQDIQRTVFIKAPRGLDYGSVAKVVDAVKMGGASPVSLQIDGLD